MKTDKKKIIFNVVVMVIVTGLSVLFFVRNGVLNKENLSKVTFESVSVVVALYFLSMFLWAACDYFTIKPTLNDFTLKRSFNDLIYGKLASSVTPLKSGHFPMRTMLYMEYGYVFYESLTALSKCQITASVASVLNYATVFVISTIKGYSVTFNGQTVGLNIVVLIGLAFHVLTITLVCLLAFVKPFQNFFISLVSKLKFRKDEEKRKEFAENERIKYEIYRDRIKEMLGRFYLYLLPVLIYIVYMFCTSSLPYAAFLAVGGGSFNFAEFLRFYLLTIGSTYITNVIPVPGGVGSSEMVFGLLFAEVISGEFLGGTLLVWRLGSFYLPVVFAIIQFYISQAVLAARLKKEKNE